MHSSLERFMRRTADAWEVLVPPSIVTAFREYLSEKHQERELSVSKGSKKRQKENNKGKKRNCNQARNLAR